MNHFSPGKAKTNHCLVYKLKYREKYPEAFRQFCFTLHYHNPRAYEFIRTTFDNHLPHATTIRSWYANSDMNTKPNGINEQCLNIIRKKVTEMAEKNKQLVVGVAFDEMSIRKHIQWSNKDHKLVGYSKFIRSEQDGAQEVKLDITRMG